MKAMDKNRMYNLINYGKTRTQEVAQMKDWRCRSRRALRMRQIARKWVETNSGAMLLTIKQMKALYPDVVPASWQEDGLAYWWAIEKESNSNKINFVRLF